MLSFIAKASARNRDGHTAAGAALLIFLVAAPGKAQAPGNVQTFTVEAAVNYAVAHYPAVRAALGRVRAAQAGVNVAHTAYLPEANALWQANRGTHNNTFGQLLPQSVVPALSGPVLPTTSDSSVWGSTAGVLLSWEPFDFGYRGAQMKVARVGQTAATAEAELTRLDVTIATVNAYLALVAAEQITQTERAAVERREVFANAVNVLAQNQLRPGADASRAQADLAAARIRLVHAQTAENTSRAQFANLLGLAASQVEVAPGRLVSAVPETAVPATAPTSNPSALAQQARIEEATSREGALAKSYFPKVVVQTGVSGRGSGADPAGNSLGGASGLGLQRMNWIAGVQVTFPALQIFSLRAQREVERANEATEKARYDQQLQDISGRVAEARIALDGARQVAQNTPIELSAARDSQQQVQARYDAGLATLSDVSEAERVLVQAEADDAVARLGVWRGIALVAAAQGNLQPFLDMTR